MNLFNRLLFIAAVFGLQLSSAGFTFGQANFKELPIEKLETSKAIGMIRNREGLDAALVKRYAQNEMSRLTSAKELANYASIRSALLLTVRTGESDQAKKIAADAIIAYGSGIAGSNAFHPASRVNAMLALAELDTASNQPYAGGFEKLLTAAKDVNVPMHLRAIALWGVNRQVKFYNANINANKKQEISREMVAIAASQTNNSLDMKTHAWLVRRAYDVLSSLGSPLAVNPALARVVDDKELPSLRLASSEYLSKIDLTPLPEDKKVEYFLGVAQMIEQQLVGWYTREDDLIKAKSGAGAGGFGYPGGGMGDMMGDMGGSMMGSSGAEGYDMGTADGAYGGGSGYGTAPVKKKAIDTQTWSVRLARRSINQIAQVGHVSLDGKPLKDAKPISATAKSLLDIGLPAELASQAKQLVEAIENFQTAVNDPALITDINSLLGEAEHPIEAIMDLVREIPEFKVRYPDYKDGDELATVEAEKPAEAAPPATGEVDGGTGEAAPPAAAR